MDNFKLIAKEKNMDYRLVTPVQSVYGWVDKDKFEKIFFNLLSNAFKYTSPGKAITIKVIPKEESVDIEVKDEGIGIVPDKQRVLFQRFESLVKQNILQPSSGIGLSLAKEMVEMHHGSIQVSSQPGVGSTFTVTLPLQQKVFEEDMQAELILDDDKQETVSAANGLDGENAYMEETEMTDSDCNSILVVEDNNELRHFLKSSLSGSYNVITASNGKEGLQRAIDNVPDLIISDVMMPIMDGLEMIGQIKQTIISATFLSSCCPPSFFGRPYRRIGTRNRRLHHQTFQFHLPENPYHLSFTPAQGTARDVHGQANRRQGRSFIG